jgi:hypothetical protein
MPPMPSARPLLLSLSLLACDGGPRPPPAAAERPTPPAAPAPTAAPAAPVAAPAGRLPAPARLVAIGDVHGDLEATRAVLRLAGAIDERDRWVGGPLVVVQTGDQLDRGDGERAILDLLARLQGEATAAGGALHVLNGNHELMNVAGDLRYVTAGGFLDFAEVPGVDLADPRAASVPPAMRGRLLAFAPGGPYARQLAARPVLLQVGDSVFAHGGVLPAHARRGPEALNEEVRRWMLGEGEISPDLLQGDESPVWTRRYCQDPGPADCAAADEALTALGARRMVVGHTVHKEGIARMCDGKVWCIDVGMAAYYGGRPEALEIVGDEVRPLH